MLLPEAHCYPCRLYVLSCGPGNVPASLDQGLKEREQPSQGEKSETFTWAWGARAAPPEEPTATNTQAPWSAHTPQSAHTHATVSTHTAVSTQAAVSTHTAVSTQAAVSILRSAYTRLGQHTHRGQHTHAAVSTQAAVSTHTMVSTHTQPLPGLNIDARCPGASVTFLDLPEPRGQLDACPFPCCGRGA